MKILQQISFEQLWDLAGKRVITFYLLAVVLLMSFVDHESVMSHARGATLSRLMPASFDYLYNVSIGTEELDPSRLKEYANYYQKVVDFIPRSDAFGVLGYISFHLGKDKKAVSCFRKAISIDAQAFSFYYNLGIIYFRRGYYGEAAEYLEKAVATSIDANLAYITSSKIYFPFLGSTSEEELPSRLKLYLKKSYRNAYRLLIFSHMYVKDYKKMLFYAGEGIGVALQENNDFYYYAGLAAFHMGKFKQAAALFKQFINTHPSDGNAYYYLGLTLRALGDEDSSAKILKRAEALHYYEGGPTAEIETISLNIF